MTVDAAFAHIQTIEQLEDASGELGEEECCFADYVAEHYGERVVFHPAKRYGPSEWPLFSVYRFRREEAR